MLTSVVLAATLIRACPCSDRLHLLSLLSAAVREFTLSAHAAPQPALLAFMHVPLVSCLSLPGLKTEATSLLAALASPAAAAAFSGTTLAAVAVDSKGDAKQKPKQQQQELPASDPAALTAGVGAALDRAQNAFAGLNALWALGLGDAASGADKAAESKAAEAKAVSEPAVPESLRRLAMALRRWIDAFQGDGNGDEHGDSKRCQCSARVWLQTLILAFIAARPRLWRARRP